MTPFSILLRIFEIIVALWIVGMVVVFALSIDKVFWLQ